jgi:hypothetical protein
MTFLLDEQLPIALRHHFGKEHKVFTTTFMGWTGKKNGELLGLLSLHEFDALVTNDKNMRFQQNLSKFLVKIIVLNAPTNDITDLIQQVEKLNEILKKPLETQVIEIN